MRSAATMILFAMGMRNVLDVELMLFQAPVLFLLLVLPAQSIAEDRYEQRLRQA
jgi:Zn-dependent membrane protease YugP